MTQQFSAPAFAPADEALDNIIRRALAEDLGDGDVTTLNTIPFDAAYTGDFLVKAPGVIAGLQVAARVFATLDPAVQFQAFAPDGDRVSQGDIVAVVTGPVPRSCPASGWRSTCCSACRESPRPRGATWTLSPAPGAVSWTRARPSPACGCWTSGRSGWAAGKPPHRAVRHGADQGQPHRGGRLHHRGRAPGARQRSAAAAHRGRSEEPGGIGRGAGAADRPHHAGQHEPRR